MSEPVVMVCMRVAWGPPQVSSCKETCDRCRELVWVDPVGRTKYQERYEVESFVYRCLPCSFGEDGPTKEDITEAIEAYEEVHGGSEPTA